MSRKGRDAQLIEALYGPVVKTTDCRYTPRSTVEALFNSDPPPAGQVLDPCAGDGIFCRVAKERGYQPEACEIRADEEEKLRSICGRFVKIGDFLKAVYPPIAITSNPAFSIARDVAAHALEDIGSPWLFLLLRANVLGSNPWRSFWEKHPPSRLRPVKRPSFGGPAADLQRECSQPRRHTAENPTDASEYLFIGWVAGEPPLNMKPIP